MKHKHSPKAYQREVARKKEKRAEKLARRREKSKPVPVKLKKQTKAQPPAPVKVRPVRQAKQRTFEIHEELRELEPALAETLTFVLRFRKRRRVGEALKVTDHLRVLMKEGRAYYRVRCFPRSGIVALQWIRKRGEMFELRTGRTEHGVYPSMCIPFEDKQRALNALRSLL